MKRNVYLGKVAEFVTTSRGRKFAHLLPLYEASDDLYSWVRVIDESMRLREFRNRGLVSWTDPPPDVVEGSIWEFEITKSSTFEPDRGSYDEFRVSGQPKEPTEVLDLRDMGGEDQSRLLLTLEGLPLSFAPASLVFLWIDEHRCIGPVRLVKHGQSNVWIIDPEQSKDRIPCYRFSPTGIHVLDPRLVCSTSNVRPSGAHEFVDWDPDDAVLRHVLRRLRRIDAKFTDSLDLTYKAIDHHTAAIMGPDSSISDIELENYRLRRVQRLASKLNEHAQLAEDVVKALAESGPIKDDLERERQRILEKVREEVSSQVRIGIADETTRLEALHENVREQRKVRDELTREIEAQRATLERTVERFDEALAARLEHVLAKPEESLAEIALFRAMSVLLGNRRNERKSEIALATIGGQHQAMNGLEDGRGTIPASIGEIGELRQMLRRALIDHGVSHHITRPLHATFLAGGIPILTGSKAFDALLAYASCVTGSRVCWLPISATVLEPIELLGHVDPSTQRFIPHASGLVDLLLHSPRTEDLHLVVLEGVNRAAIDAYLSPLLACHADAWHQSGIRALPLFAPTAVAGDDPYASAHRLAWSPNVLLAGLAIDGTVTQPLPKILWNSALLIQCDFLENLAEIDAVGESHPDQREMREGETLPHAVTKSVWKEWRRSCQEKNLSECSRLWSEIADKFGLEPGPRDFCLRFFAASQSWPAEAHEALVDVIAYCLIPQLAYATGTDEHWFDKFRLPYRDVRKALHAAAGLSG